MPVRQLTEAVVNRIAAGEVVERPASVVKELVENALDAGATRIDVITEGGGRRRITVTDDGCGMGRGDLVLAVERHATSKLDDEDLLDIRTLGFRGEALPSIGAVAKLLITTRHAEEPHAWALAVEGGRKGEPKPAALAQGTRIDVRDLFYATPARLKFLKAERSETEAIRDVVRRLAMARPDVAFTLAGEERAPVTFPAAEATLLGHDGAASGRLTRLADVLGADFAQNAVPVRGGRDGLSVVGFAGLPTFNKANSLSQYLFVNGRPVRDKLLFGAVRGAYADHLARDRHPVVALFVDVDPREVDVNVHPAKAEVRFRDAGLVRATIVRALMDALALGAGRAASTGGGATLAALRPRTGAPQAGGRPAGAATGWTVPRRLGWDWRGSPARPPAAAGHDAADQDTVEQALPDGFTEPAQAVFDVGPPSADARATAFRHDDAAAGDADDRPLGAARAQLHENYIVAQTRDGIVIVDQHAAHERIVYERMKAALADGGIARQLLLIPAVVELDEADVERLAARAEELAGFGLVLEAFGPGAVAVRETPGLLGRLDVGALVRDLAEHLAEWDSTLPLERRLLHVAATMACHGSIRSGRRLKPEEMNALLREMEQTPNAGQCNHGRPTYVELKLSDIERLFGRT
ncbi:DNA mismatch repair endonuclease MutL [Rhodoplanes sp. TEM]|uniref:DNA mismatch repair protein MutL n=1 Tax=Rhodoplanes tepidamans TaxID=200616 RepID=A0ABT5JKQ2_RHOTP|nr:MULTISPECIES: DNA mismatch repair endonuclease MutL [Rhodoplanes]MDC7789844.1 DNA mismatch repair endonuclease MutL [Rhodoplanes tepidamans]MDC7987778.1 DNA mismatch repair endonuclease MutL [Rhodoplanes sp. TEM]MDQ0358495.1 DNA mismatch repair protein MutL [Rhodoplanes tepidamans]